MLHTVSPSPAECAIICDRLVKTNPVLKDSVGSGYVRQSFSQLVQHMTIHLLQYTLYQDSWKKKLRNRFKNIRRPQRAAKLGLTIIKKAKTEETESEASLTVTEAAPSCSDLDEYERHVRRIQKLYSGRKWVMSQFSILLVETFSIRRKWILEDSPSAEDVLEKFPCLKECSLVKLNNMYVAICITVHQI